MLEQEENKKEEDNGCLELISGCGCAIFLIWVFLSIVIWAWHIHPIFGIIIFLILCPK